MPRPTAAPTDPPQRDASAYDWTPRFIAGMALFSLAWVSAIVSGLVALALHVLGVDGGSVLSEALTAVNVFVSRAVEAVTELVDFDPSG